MSRLLIAALAVLLGLVASASSLSAYEVWCFDDPILDIDGVEMQIVAGVLGEPDFVKRTVQAAETTVYVPKGVKVKVLERTNDFFTEKVKVRHTDEPWNGRMGIPVRVELRFQSAQELPARARITLGGTTVELFGTTTGVLATSLTAFPPVNPPGPAQASPSGTRVSPPLADGW